MKISVHDIQVTNPLRDTGNGELDELVQSMKEKGQAVPIKVRPVNGHYELVYGGRRLEAAKRLGWPDIDAIVGELEDFDALAEGIVENVQRKNMNDIEEGEAYKRLMSFGLTRQQIAAIIGKDNAWVGRCVALVDDPVSQTLLDQIQTGDMANKAAILRQTLGDNIEARQAIAQKAVKEELSRSKLRRVAEAYAAAKTPSRKQAVLETDGNIPEFDRVVGLASMVKKGEQKDIERRQREHEEYPREVKDFINAIDGFTGKVLFAIDGVQFGRYSPEAARFVVRKLDRLVEEVENLQQQLKGQGNE